MKIVFAMITFITALVPELSISQSWALDERVPADSLTLLVKEQQDEQQQFRTAMSQGDASRRAQLSAEHGERRRQFAKRAFDIARANPDQTAAVDTLIWVVESVEMKDEALSILAKDYLASERLTKACRISGHLPFPSAERLLKACAEKSPHRSVRGTAYFMLARRLVERAELVRLIKNEPNTVDSILSDYGSAERSEIVAKSAEAHILDADRLYSLVLDKYRDVIFEDRFGNQVSLGEKADGALFRLHNLELGKSAPDIIGTDVQGQTFRLSDYQGKTILLTFSGDWCGPCRADYPAERHIVEHFAGRPFVLVSVNTDSSRDILRETILRGDVTWRCWWDGGTSGPIASRWGIESYPTYYLIDGRGLIVRKGSRVNASLKEAIDSTFQPKNFPVPDQPIK